jgi:hypothetical protein
LLEHPKATSTTAELVMTTATVLKRMWILAGADDGQSAAKPLGNMRKVQRLTKVAYGICYGKIDTSARHPSGMMI